MTNVSHPIDIAELRRLHEAATAGPWRFDGDWHRIPTILGPSGQHLASVEKEPGPERDSHTPEQAANAHLIAAIRTVLPALLDLIEALDAENARLRKIAVPEWFYPPDDYGSESCMWSPGEVIDYIDPEPGNHVIEINVATPLPSIWCAVRVTDDEDADERLTFTEHATEAEARAALPAAPTTGGANA